MKHFYIQKGRYKSYNPQTGYTNELSVYQSKDCSNCPFKNEYTKAEGKKTIKASKKLKEERNNSLQNIISPEEINLRVTRSIQVEGAFGVLKNDYKFKRFLTVGKTNVSLEFELLCFGYNMNKLYNKIQSERTGIYLHKCEVTA